MALHSPMAMAPLLLMLAVVACAHSPHEADIPSDERMPKVATGILRRAPSCTQDEKIPMMAHVRISMTLFTDAAKDKRVEVYKSDDKLIPGIGNFLTFPGLELGLLGACAGEVRMLRIPAEVGYAEMGNPRLDIPPNTPLRAKVEIKSFHMPTGEEEQEYVMHPDPDLGVSPDGGGAEEADGAEGAGDEAFPAEVTQLTDASFDSETKGKNAFVLVHAPWCGHCVRFKPAFGKVAQAFAGEADVMVVAVDGTENEGLATRFEVQGFPTVLLLRETGEKVPYEGPRDSKNVIAFLNKELKKNVVL